MAIFSFRRFPFFRGETLGQGGREKPPFSWVPDMSEKYMSESQGQQQTKAGRTIASLFSSPAKKEKVQAQRFVWGQRNSSLKKIKWVLFDGGFLFFFPGKRIERRAEYSGRIESISFFGRNSLIVDSVKSSSSFLHLHIWPRKHIFSDMKGTSEKERGRGGKEQRRT